MTKLLLILAVFFQGIPVQPTQTGTITGTLRDSAGKPAVDIRVMASPRPETFEVIAGEVAAFSSLSQTDEQGRFRLEGVPPGRYLVAAGNLSLPTYYPGTQAMIEGRVLVVAPGETINSIDFVLKDSSAGRS